MDKDAPTKTMLGKDQRVWLTDGLKDSDAIWHLWGNQTMFAGLYFMGATSKIIPKVTINNDQWNGFVHERNMIKDVIDNYGIKNVVILSGDMHTSLIAEVKRTGGEGAPGFIAVEFMTPSITSPNLQEEHGILHIPFIMDKVDEFIQDRNHHLRHFDSEHHGYAILTLKEGTVEWRVYSVPAIMLPVCPKPELMVSAVYDGTALMIDDKTERRK